MPVSHVHASSTSTVPERVPAANEIMLLAELEPAQFFRRGDLALLWRANLSETGRRGLMNLVALLSIYAAQEKNA